MMAGETIDKTGVLGNNQTCLHVNLFRTPFHPTSAFAAFTAHVSDLQRALKEKPYGISEMGGQQRPSAEGAHKTRQCLFMQGSVLADVQVRRQASHRRPGIRCAPDTIQYTRASSGIQHDRSQLFLWHRPGGRYGQRGEPADNGRVYDSQTWRASPHGGFGLRGATRSSRSREL